MPKLSYREVFLASMQSVALLLLCMGLGALRATGQVSALPSSSSSVFGSDSLRSLMLEAAKVNGLRDADWPWHLKVSFSIFDNQGTIKDQGTYEEYWVSSSKYKQSYTSAGFTQTDYGTDKGVMRVGEAKWPPYLLRQIRKAFVEPMPLARELENLRFTSENYAGTMLCIRKPNAPTVSTGHATISTYCLVPTSPDLRVTMTGIDNGALFPLFRATRTKIAAFKGRTVPYDLQIGVNMNMKNLLTAHLETLEVLKKPDDALFAPPPGAGPPPDKSAIDPGPVSLDASTAIGVNQSTPLSGIALSSGVSTGLLLTKVDPIYPPIARAARVSGTVVLEGHINREGKITDLQVMSGPPMLQQSALNAVKQWTYMPYLVHGEAVEFSTTINVIFSLPKPPS